jgi:CRISPR-associated protein Csm4
MRLIRYKLRPRGSWITPWRADTLTGLLASQLVAESGVDEFRRLLADPWGREPADPPFVLSDAMPGDLLPKPDCVGFFFSDPKERKEAKGVAWLTPDQFHMVQEGEKPKLAEAKPVLNFVRMRNVLDRTTSTTGAAGGPATLYSVPAACLNAGYDYLSLYARVSESGEGLLDELIRVLSQRGFGADAAVGHGQFDVEGPEDPPKPLDSVDSPSGWISLSTFQPSPNDPVDGYWRSFMKYGRLGPDVPVDGVFKRPQWMLEPGACFKTGGEQREWYGRLIGTKELLPETSLKQLAGANIEPVQPAFALAVPMRWIDLYEA